MVRALYEKIRAPIRGLHEAAYTLALLTLASQALALLRDRAFAHAFGAGQTLDLYFAAFRIPDLIFALVASLVSAYVLIPRLSHMPPARAREMLSESVSFLLIVGGVLALCLAIFMPRVLALLYPSLAASSEMSSFVGLARLLLIQPIVLGISGIITSVTQVHRRFFLFALSPVLYNIGIMAGVLLFYPRMGLEGIGVGVLFGAILHVAIHVPLLREHGMFPSFARPTYQTIAPLVMRSVPRSLALGIGSITALVLTTLAAGLAEGSVSVFSFAGNLEAVPLSLIGASYAVAAFPALSEASADHTKERFTRILSNSGRHLILWSIISFGLIVVLRAHLVRVILGTGAFDWDATRLTAALLAILSIGLAAQGLILLFFRALYAMRESWRPLLYQVVGGVLTIFGAYVLLSLPSDGFPSLVARALRVSDIPDASVLLIAVALTAGNILIALLATLRLSRLLPGLVGQFARPVMHGILAALAGAVGAYGVLSLLGSIAPLTTLFAVFADGFAAGVAGLLLCALTLHILKNEEFSDALKSAKHLLGAHAPAPPSAEEPARS